MSIEELVSTDQSRLIHPFSALAIQGTAQLTFFERGEGVWLTTRTGDRYLDAAGGLWCVNVGYGRREIVDAVSNQMAQTAFLHSFANFTHQPLVRLTEKLFELLPPGFDRIFYGVSGSDANDTHVKIIWRYNNILGRPNKKKIVARIHGYHGSTVVAGSLTGISGVHRSFDIPRPGFLHTVAADWHRRPAHIQTEEEFTGYLVSELEKLILAEGPETVAAFFAEPICGSGGILLPPRGYFPAVQALLKRYDILLVADEVITGFGRTGKWFATPGFEIQPDLLTLAKGLTSGYLPMSASVVSKRVSEVLYSEREEDGAFGHGFTSSGHPTCAAAALANIAILEQESLFENAAVVGESLMKALRDRFAHRRFVSNIRGRGLLMAIEFDKDPSERIPFPAPNKAGQFVIRTCFEEKLIVRGARGRALIAMAPPLTLTRAEADQIVERLQRAIPRIEAAMAVGEFG